MDRRAMIGALGLGATGVLALGRTADADEPQTLTYHSMLDKTHVKCLDHCTACAAVCNEAAAHCLAETCKASAHRDMHASAHQFAMDCAAMCSVSAGLVARKSPLMAAMCTACAEACRRCGEACEKAQGDAAIMKDCVRICRECESSCREMSRMMGAKTG